MTKRQNDKDQKESLMLRRQGTFALLRCLYVCSGHLVERDHKFPQLPTLHFRVLRCSHQNALLAHVELV